MPRTAVRAAGSAVAALALLVLACGDPAGPGGTPSAMGVAMQRGADLGPDDATVDEIRVTLETGTVNGAGTDNDVLLWFDNREHRIARDPATAFAPGAVATTILIGRDVPDTLGALRRASIVLSLRLARAEIAVSWFCQRALLEVKLRGSEAYRPYLEDREVGWLSQDEPPRRSTAYALQ